MTVPKSDSDARGAIEEGVRLFNSGHYYETHEVLEDAWRTAEEPMKTFLKGLIHAAVAFYQYGRRNLPGALSKHRSTHHYLAPYLPSFQDVDVAQLLSEMDLFFTSILDSDAPAWRPDSEPRPVIRRTSPQTAV